MNMITSRLLLLKAVYTVLLPCAVIVVSCHKPQLPGRFDGAKAFGYLEKQVAMGPRNPGSTGWRTCQEWIVAHCDSLGVVCRKQPFDYSDFLTGDTLELVNIIASINPDVSCRILIAAHYDCRPRADHDPDSTKRQMPIAGANDGASGTAVLMHLIDLMSSQPPTVGVDLVFFDGEDYGPPGRDEQYLIGSTYFASHNQQKYRFGLLLDMVGDRDLKIYREYYSELHAKKINDKVWKKAVQQGLTQFIDHVKDAVIDDHLPLISGGIPTIDIIDMDYPYWHTQADTPDKCSPVSLEAVGQLVMEVIYDE